MAVPGTAIAVARDRPTEATGAVVLWSSEFTPRRARSATGELTVEYGGQRLVLRLEAKDPDKAGLPLGRLDLSLTQVPMPPGDQGWLLFDHAVAGKRDALLSYRTEPYFERKQARVRDISEALEEHIRGWLDGRLPPEIPASALLDEPGLSQLNNRCSGWVLRRPERNSKRWAARSIPAASREQTAGEADRRQAGRS